MLGSLSSPSSTSAKRRSPRRAPTSYAARLS
jgi:hypothetical protein